jgi:dTDP-glucose 4,6-dehydratase
METIIVTGAAGFIGSNFCRMAAESGYRVLGYDLLTYAGHRANLEGIKGNFSLVVGDICDSASFLPLLKEKPSAVLNFAAESHVDRSIEDPLLFVRTNVMGTANLLHLCSEIAAADSAFRFVQISTDEVFGELGDSGYFTESTPLNPSSPYSASKSAADQLAMAWWRTFQFPVVVTRCSNNYGPRQFPEKLIPRLLFCALNNKPLPVYGNGRNVRDWIHVEDHCRGILLALQKGKLGETYCFGGKSERRNIDVVEQLCAILDKLRPASKGPYSNLISFVEDRKGHDYRYAIDDSKAERELGFSRNFNFDDGLKSTVHWYLKNDGWLKKISERD